MNAIRQRIMLGLRVLNPCRLPRSLVVKSSKRALATRSASTSASIARSPSCSMRISSTLDSASFHSLVSMQRKLIRLGPSCKPHSVRHRKSKPWSRTGRPERQTKPWMLSTTCNAALDLLTDPHSFPGVLVTMILTSSRWNVTIMPPREWSSYSSPKA